MLDAKYEGYEPWEIPAGTRKAGCMLPFFEAIVFIPEQIGVHLDSLKLIIYGEVKHLRSGGDDQLKEILLNGQWRMVGPQHYLSISMRVLMEIRLNGHLVHLDLSKTPLQCSSTKFKINFFFFLLNTELGIQKSIWIF